MSQPDQDSRIAAAFSALRQDEEEQCPTFASVLARARMQSRRRVASHRPLLAVATGTAIAIAVLAAWISLRVEQPPEPRPSIVEWRSPTGFLLETPGREVLTGPEGLGRSVLDLATPTERRSSS
ncbi:MAG TPA: hypothetical protein VGX68_15615 [Thermoanaerobaculia bacterium]|jgi:hypothetical protein|nr:hypothetical protein [Thermoanaerobaculia bacterium]